MRPSGSYLGEYSKYGIGCGMCIKSRINLISSFLFYKNLQNYKITIINEE